MQGWIKKGGVNDKSRHLAYTAEWVVSVGLFGYVGKLQTESRKNVPDICVYRKMGEN